MVVKVYISGISGNKEVKKRQQRVLMILDSKNIQYEIIDITEPGRENDKEFMQNNAKNNGGTVSDPNPRSPLPPQVFNDEEYCGDYDQFDMANECDTLEQFLKVELPPEETVNSENVKTDVINGDIKTDTTEQLEKSSKEGSQEKETVDEIDKSNEGTPRKNSTPAKEGTPVKEDTLAKEDTTVKEGTPIKESTPVKEGTPAKEASAIEDELSAKEGSPAREENERQSTDREGTPSEKSILNKESSPETKASSPDKDDSVNENGTVSSREHSVDAQEETDKKKGSVSESLIESEKLASTE